MSVQPREVTFAEFYRTYRGQIVLAYDGAKELALKNFDDIAQKLQEALLEIDKLKHNTETPVVVEPKNEAK